MRKFVVRKDKITLFKVYEVECEIIQGIEDPSVLHLPVGEYRARILSPDVFHMKMERMVDGKSATTLVPDIWYSHGFIDTLDAAKSLCEACIRYDLVTFPISKHREPATEEALQEALSKMEVVRL